MPAPRLQTPSGKGGLKRQREEQKTEVRKPPDMTQTDAWRSKEHPGKSWGPETARSLTQEQEARQHGSDEAQGLANERSAMPRPCPSRIPTVLNNKVVDVSTRPPNTVEKVEEKGVLTHGGAQGSQALKRAGSPEGDPEHLGRAAPSLPMREKADTGGSVRTPGHPRSRVEVSAGRS